MCFGCFLKPKKKVEPIIEETKPMTPPPPPPVIIEPPKKEPKTNEVNISDFSAIKEFTMTIKQ
jgi:hypothetical protein